MRTHDFFPPSGCNVAKRTAFIVSIKSRLCRKRVAWSSCVCAAVGSLARERERAHNNTWTERILVCSCFFQLKLTWQIIFNLIKFYDRFMEQTAIGTLTHTHIHALTRAYMNIAFFVVSIADIVNENECELRATNARQAGRARSSTTYSVWLHTIADTKHDV